MFPALMKEKTAIAEVITESMTAALAGKLISLTHVHRAPRLATKTV